MSKVGWAILVVTLLCINNVFAYVEIKKNNNDIEEPSLDVILQPEVVITYPTNNSVFTEPEITLAGYAVDELGLDYIDYVWRWEGGGVGSSWPIDPPVESHEFEWSFVLYEGWNRFNVTAGNVENSYVKDEINITYDPDADTEPPIVVVEYPENGSTFFDPFITITGYATDNIGITGWGYTTVFPGEEVFPIIPIDPPQTEIQIEIVELQLVEGQNIIEVFAQDDAGNQGYDIIEIWLAETEEGLLIDTVFQPVQTVYQDDPIYGDDLEGGPCEFNAKLGMVAGKNTYIFGHNYSNREQIKIKVHNNYSVSKTFSFVIKIYPDDKEIWRSNQVTVPAKTKMIFAYDTPLPNEPFQWVSWGDKPKSKDGKIVLSLDPNSAQSPADYNCTNVTVNVKIYHTHDLKILFVPLTFSEGPDFPPDLANQRGYTAFDEWRWDTLTPWWQATYPLKENGLFTARSWFGNIKKDVTIGAVKVNNLTTFQELSNASKAKVRLQMFNLGIAPGWMSLYDRVVFLVDPRIIDGNAGLAILSQPGGNYKQGVLVNWGMRDSTVVHEVGHTYNLEDNYELNENGTITKKGDLAVGYWVNKKKDVPQSAWDVMAAVYDIWGSSEKTWIKKPNFKSLLKRFNEHRDPTVLGISGFIDKNDYVRLNSWYKLDEGNIDLEWGTAGNYLVKAYNKNGDLLNQTGFNVSFTSLVDPGGETPINETIFAFRLEWINGTKRIDIVNATSDELIATRTISEHSPQVSILSPQQGESIQPDSYKITWNASDADNDTLEFHVFMSNDSGENWFPIGMALRNNSLTADFSYLEGNNYQIKVIATDDINVGAMVSEKFTILPSTPNNSPDRPNNSSPANGDVNIPINTQLSWECTDPDGDALTYDVYFGTTSNPPKVTSNQTLTIYNPALAYSTTYYWKISAWDIHGAKNESSVWHFTTQAYVPPSPQNQKPMVTITFPSADATVSSVIIIQGTASDNDGTVQKVEIRIDSGLWIAVTGTTSWSYSWDTTDVENGNHTLQARSFDSEDRSGIVSVTVNVFNNRKPTVTISSPLNGTEVNGTVNIQGTSSDEDGNDTIQKTEVKIETVDWTAVNGTTSWNYSWNTTNVDNGEYSIQVRSYDGHEYSSIDSLTVNVRNKEGDDGGGIPGFELALLVIAIGAILLLNRKKIITS